MEFEKLILERKSTRNFTDEIINTEIIYKITVLEAQKLDLHRLPHELKSE